MDLAKPCLDVGLRTDDADAALAFWTGPVGLEVEGRLPTGGGNLQHRLALHGSVLKVNVGREPAGRGDLPTGYAGLTVLSDCVNDEERFTDPDGLPVVVRPAAPGQAGIEIVVRVADPDAQARFYQQVFDAVSLPDGLWAIGASILRIDGGGPVEAGPMNAVGFRYLTVQVFDVDAEHAAAVEAGATEAMAPTTLGDVARISFVRDPHGNWIELSQRASLTGPLPA